jgi:hypothetical protein
MANLQNWMKSQLEVLKAQFKGWACDRGLIKQISLQRLLGKRKQLSNREHSSLLASLAPNSSTANLCTC